jgi:hypothetical protein
MTAAELVAALGGRMHGKSGGTACCPAHEDRNPSLSIADGRDGRLLIHCHAGCEQLAVIKTLRGWGLWRDRCAAEDPPLSEADRDRERQRDRAREETVRRRAGFIDGLWRRTWVEAVPPQNSPIERWLQARCIPPDRLELDRLPLRWAPRCPLGKGSAPAMVALMTDPITCEPVGLHRTFLSPNGCAKAPTRPRRMLGKAGIIRLSPDDEVELGLGICEGIETGLSIIAAGWRPVWACGSLGMLQRFPVLPGIAALTVFADPKPHEIKGARACAQRWVDSGREAFVYVPPSDGDWNVVLSAGGTRS